VTARREEAMKAPGDLGWKKWRKLQADPSRRRHYAQSRASRYRRYLGIIASKLASLS
jgi:hypothetical protein